MGAPGILTGSETALNLFRQSSAGGTPLSRTGVFGAHPGATPKYALNDASGGRARDAEYRDTLARLFVEVPDTYMEQYLASMSAETRPLAQVLAGGGATAGSSGTGFLDFLLETANESQQEKAQIVETLTDHYVAFYSGASAPLFSYGGTVLNTYQDDQRVWMLRLYSEILRGTRLAHHGLVAKLRYDSVVVSGYLESLHTHLTGNEINGGKFQFTFRVKRFSIFTPSLSLPTVVDVNTTSGAGLTGGSVQPGVNERVATLTPETPPTATEGPAAEGMAMLSDDEIRTRLRAAGLPDEQIDQAIEAGTAAGVLREVDPREEEVQASAEGTDRIAEFVQGDGIEVNPDAVQDDGVGGLTTVRGDTSQITDADRARIIGEESVRLSEMRAGSGVTPSDQARIIGAESIRLSEMANRVGLTTQVGSETLRARSGRRTRGMRDVHGL